MIIFGFNSIACPSFKKIDSLESNIDLRLAKEEVLYFSSKNNYDLAKELSDKNIDFGVVLIGNIDYVKEMLIYANIGAKYIILDCYSDKFCDIKSVKILQEIINYYLLDCKLLYVVESDLDITNIIGLHWKKNNDLKISGIDGVIFKDYLYNNKKANLNGE